MQVTNQSKPLTNNQEKVLSQWIKNQPLYKEQDPPSNRGLSSEQADAIISIRK
ncbi:hypothetical protein [Paracidovorax konjaci]|uniref:hypothetical protein n=1 Tax=Paracidovorax konjaci TaxID=32040 RepID=UPI001587B0AC|nr:hypothetical protein [Paracidovorax konjaci]